MEKENKCEKCDKKAIGTSIIAKYCEEHSYKGENKSLSLKRNNIDDNWNVTYNEEDVKEEPSTEKASASSEPASEV